ncbi:unnamed protein product [Rhizophagus irregularis]|nr:unnamed protein product [Rhizophagus irregularis]
MPGKQVSKANRERIISVYFTGTKQRVISVQLNIPESTICDIVKKYKETGSTEPKQRPGRPKTLKKRDTRALKRIIRTDQFSPLGDVTDKFNTSLDTTFYYNTVRRYLHDEGLGNGQARVWRSPRETYNKDCIQSTVKFGGGSIMFWGVLGWHGVGPLIVVEGNMDSDEYVNILDNHFISWVDNYPNSIFQQDGASCHTSTYTVWWMRTHNIPILDWVAQSPDLNPIENLWNHLDSQVRKRKPVPRSKQELIEVIQDEWRKITIETCQRLILSMPNRVKAVIKAKGGHTKY